MPLSPLPSPSLFLYHPPTPTTTTTSTPSLLGQIKWIVYACFCFFFNFFLLYQKMCFKLVPEKKRRKVWVFLLTTVNFYYIFVVVVCLRCVTSWPTSSPMCLRKHPFAVPWLPSPCSQRNRLCRKCAMPTSERAKLACRWNCTSSAAATVLRSRASVWKTVTVIKRAVISTLPHFTKWSDCVACCVPPTSALTVTSPSSSLCASNTWWKRTERLSSLHLCDGSPSLQHLQLQFLVLPALLSILLQLWAVQHRSPSPTSWEDQPPPARLSI